MRRVILTAGLGLLISITAVAAPDRQTPEGTAYFSFGFGGDKPGVRAVHYGFRLDHDRYFVPTDQHLPALMQLDFSRRGLSAIEVNGLNVLRPAYRMRQSEEVSEGAAVEEEGGFFDGIADFFTGLFGDDEEESEVVDNDGDEAVAADDGYPAAEGAFISYNLVDWGLLAVGLAGIGFAATEVVEAGDDADPQAAPPPPPPSTPCPVPPLPAPPGCTPFAGGQPGVTHINVDPEYQEWLDSGTGQMGDLLARD